MSFSCKTCGAVSEHPGHLCSPSGQPSTCRDCGENDVAANHICVEKIAAFKVTCESCGRMAMDKSQVCKPVLI